MKKYLLFIGLIFIFVYGAKSKTYSEKVLPSDLIVIAKSGLVLREYPSQSAKSIAIIPFKTKVSLIEASEQSVQIKEITAPWYKVKWGTKEGWAFSGFLKTVVPYSNQILLNNYLTNRISIPNDVIFLKSRNGEKINFEDLDSVPDILIDSELLVVDRNGVFNDSLGDIYVDPEDSVYFNLKSGKTIKSDSATIFFRKSYYDSLSKTPPVLVKMQTVNNNTIAEKIYKIIKEDKSAFILHNYEIFKEKDKNQELFVKKYFDLTIFELSENGNESYLATLKSKDKGSELYNAWMIINNGTIAFSDYGNFINSFRVNKSLYILFDVWTPCTGDSGKDLYIIKNGVFEKYRYD